MASVGYSKKAEDGLFNSQHEAERKKKEDREREERQRIEKERIERRKREIREKLAARSTGNGSSASASGSVNGASGSAAVASGKQAEAASKEKEEEPLECVEALLRAGGFTRRLPWRKRRQLRAVERAAEKLRARVEKALGPENCESQFAVYAFDSVARIEVACRLELLRRPTDE